MMFEFDKMVFDPSLKRSKEISTSKYLVFSISHTVILERIGGASNRGHRNLEVACSFERPIKARFSQDGFRRKGGAFQLLSRSKRYVARANTAEQTSELATNFQDFLERLTGF